MKRAYVAGPYWADTEHGVVENIRRAGDVSLELWKLGRRFVGCELKRSYFDAAVKNLNRAQDHTEQPMLFGYHDGEPVEATP